MVKDRTSRVAECQNNYTEKTLKLALKVPNLLLLATFYKHGNIRELCDILQLWQGNSEFCLPTLCCPDT